MSVILVVDDRPINRRFLVTLLSPFGHQLLEAADGVEALEGLRTCPVRLVIADVLMPAIGGNDFLRQMRADPKSGSTPIIFYTSAVYPSKARAEAEALGVRHFLTKPAEPELILAAVNSALGTNPLPAAPTPSNKPHRPLPSVPADSIDPNAVVFVVDDDSGMRTAMSMLARQAGLKSEPYATAEAFLEACNADQSGCLVLDIGLSGMSGIALLEILRSRRIHIPTIILTGQGDTKAAVNAMKLHVLEFLEKPADSQTLLAKIFQALQADAKQRPEEALNDSIRRRMSILTCREKELVKLLVNGKSSKEIAAELHISVKTVSNHRANLMAKTHAENMADLVRMSMVGLET